VGNEQLPLAALTEAAVTVGAGIVFPRPSDHAVAYTEMFQPLPEPVSSSGVNPPVVVAV
jgi:hypothetical protein